MPDKFVESLKLPDFGLWQRMKEKRRVISFDLELTARCNNNCRHCYINLPSNDKEARQKELSFEEIERIAQEAVDLGAVWCLLTGGEPLLREDFFDVYLVLKKKGLLVSVFTNATLITEKHVDIFKKYPPRDIEITVYGVTQKTYETITRNPGSFKAFKNGLGLLLKNGIKVRLKAMALRSNVKELPEIARFCRQYTKDYFRFDPFLHLRLDRDPKRNQEIKSERLSPSEIVEIERKDPERFQALKKNCDRLIKPELCQISCDHIFHCGTGLGSFTVSYDGFFRLCSSLVADGCIYDLRKGSLTEAWENFVPQVRDMRSNRSDFLQRCPSCFLINLCMWCPANAYLETQELDSPVEYFCQLAHARKEMLGVTFNMELIYLHTFWLKLPLKNVIFLNKPA